MHRQVLITLFAVLFLVSNMNAEPPEPRKRELLNALDRRKLPSPPTLLADEIAWLKKIIHERRVGAHYPPYARELIMLGDEAEIKRAMKSYPYFPPGVDGITTLGQPRLIEYMAPVMFLDEPAAYTITGDTDADPSSTSAGLNILKTLGNSWEVPTAVQVWAKESYPAVAGRFHLNEEVRAIMRTWWKENEEAVKKRDWAALKPGKRMVDLEKSSPPPLADQRSAPPKPSTADTASPPVTATPATVAPPPEASNPWIWTGVGAACLALLIFALSSGSRNRPS